MAGRSTVASGWECDWRTSTRVVVACSGFLLLHLFVDFVFSSTLIAHRLTTVLNILPREFLAIAIVFYLVSIESLVLVVNSYGTCGTNILAVTASMC